MTLKYDAEGMAFPDDFTDVPAASLEAEWDRDEYATCEAAFAADYELSLLSKGQEVLIDGEPPLSGDDRIELWAEGQNQQALADPSGQYGW